MKLTEHFSLEELTHSNKAKQLGIENKPSEDEVLRLINLCKNVLEPLRARVSKPINVSSGFRNEQLNQAVGGVKESQHRRGEAADVSVESWTARQLIGELLKANIDFDQAIDEEDFDKGDFWLHVIYTKRRPNRREKKRIIIEGGVKTTLPFHGDAA